MSMAVKGSSLVHAYPFGGAARLFCEWEKEWEQMNDYKLLLDMIEQAQSGEGVFTDEIDARFSCIFKNQTFGRVHFCRKDVVFYECIDHTGIGIRFAQRYSQSRNDLKMARPENWQDLAISCRGKDCDAYISNGMIKRESPKYIVTEELAEMHVIVQAYGHDRGML